MIKEGLHAQTIAGCEETLARAVPDCKREHAVEPLRALVPPFLIRVQHHLGVGIGAEAMPALLELRSQRTEVVDLAVVGDPQALILVRHGHVAARREIDDGQSAGAEPDSALEVQSSIVRSAVGERSAQRLDVGARRIRAGELDDSADAAHDPASPNRS